MPTALIVEDEPQANELLAMLVQLRGYRTESAFTGSEALERAEGARPDIVFLDLMLPDRSGLDVCRALRSAPATAATPVVMVTARLEAENRVEGFRVGATDYIPKPYTPDQILGAMDRADACTRRLASGDLEGTIPLDARAGAATLSEVARLGALILARNPGSEERARGVGRALVELALRAEAWGTRAGQCLVATLAYTCEPDRAILTIRDRSGWFRDDPPLDPTGPIARAGLREVDYDPAEGRLGLTLWPFEPGIRPIRGRP